jgi:maleate cis-trans isomerase
MSIVSLVIPTYIVQPAKADMAMMNHNSNYKVEQAHIMMENCTPEKMAKMKAEGMDCTLEMMTEIKKKGIVCCENPAMADRFKNK